MKACDHKWRGLCEPWLTLMYLGLTRTPARRKRLRVNPSMDDRVRRGQRMPRNQIQSVAAHPPLATLLGLRTRGKRKPDNIAAQKQHAVVGTGTGYGHFPAEWQIIFATQLERSLALYEICISGQAELAGTAWHVARRPQLRHILSQRNAIFSNFLGRAKVKMCCQGQDSLIADCVE